MDQVDDEIIDGPLFIKGVSLLPEEGEIIHNYQLFSKIRETNCSVVFIGSKEDGSSPKEALKFIKRREGRSWQLVNEITLLEGLDHPRILPLIEKFPYNEYVCLVTPFAPYQSIQAIINVDYKNGLPEDLASVMMGQMLEAVQYLHSKNIWHRDIKPDNFLVYNSDIHNLQIKLCDFGYAKQYSDGEKDDKYLGTPEFMPPEIIKKQLYDKSVDIWSLGISLFVMLTNKPPVTPRSQNKSLWELTIKKGRLKYFILKDRNISPSAINLIESMCKVDPAERITVEDALMHPWILAQRKTNPLETDITKDLFQANQNARDDIEDAA